MRRNTLALVSAGLLWVAAPVYATTDPWDKTDRRLGFGLEVGDPTGLSAKYYLSSRLALEGGLGFFGWPWGSGGHLDLLYEFPEVIRTSGESFSLPLFVGGGFKGGGYVFCNVNNATHCDVDSFVGVRVPLGIAMQFKNSPLEMQFEVAPGVYAPFRYGWGGEADASFAIRYYF